MHTVLVGGGKGGVGKSSVSAGLARALSEKGLAVGVLDADLSGPSQALLFDCGALSVVDGTIRPAISSEGIHVLSTALVSRTTSALVWTDATAGSALELFIAGAASADLDYLVVDLPPGHGEVPTQAAKALQDAVGLLVTTGSALAVEECRRAATFFQRLEIPLIGIIHNMSHFNCLSCGEQSPIFDNNHVAELEAAIEVGVLAKIPLGADPSNGRSMAPVAEVFRSHCSSALPYEGS